MKQKNQQASDLPKLAAPARRALDAAGIQRLEQLAKFSEAEIAQRHGIGPNALQQRAAHCRPTVLAIRQKP